MTPIADQTIHVHYDDDIAAFQALIPCKMEALSKMMYNDNGSITGDKKKWKKKTVSRAASLRNDQSEKQRGEEVILLSSLQRKSFLCYNMSKNLSLLGALSIARFFGL